MKTKTLPKRMVVGNVVLYQAVVPVVQEKEIPVEAVLGIEIPQEEKMVDFRDLHHLGKDQEVRSSPEEMVDQVDLKDTPISYQDRIWKMLKKHTNM